MDKTKDDSIAQLSDQFMALTVISQEIEKNKMGTELNLGRIIFYSKKL